MGEGHARTVRRIVAQAVREHAAAQPGTVPAGLRRWAADTIAGPTVAWQR